MDIDGTHGLQRRRINITCGHTANVVSSECPEDVKVQFLTQNTGVNAVFFAKIPTIVS